MFSSWNMELGIHNNADMFTYVSTLHYKTTIEIT